VRWLSTNVDSVLIAQHDADDDIKTTHCHISFTNLAVTCKALDKQRQKHGLDGVNSRMLSHVVGTKTPYSEDKLAVYILKGSRDTLMASSYDSKFIDDAVESWVEHTPKEDDNDSVKSVKKTTKKDYDEYEHLRDDFTKYFINADKPHMTLDSLRTWTMRWYWKRDGRMPPATAYKRNASSLYVYFYELKNLPLDCAFEELKNLWY